MFNERDLCSHACMNGLIQAHSKTCRIRPLYEVNILCYSIGLMFILALFCKAICLLRSVFVENLVSVQGKFYCSCNINFSFSEEIILHQQKSLHSAILFSPIANTSNAIEEMSSYLTKQECAGFSMSINCILAEKKRDWNWEIIMMVDLKWSQLIIVFQFSEYVVPSFSPHDS